ncbi:hypothetical protein K9M48_03910 [Candidatus Gracilibacteria bacterium]|nr:hypothetical protein [Candidatus Gracilibacteria bacterium]
MSEIKIEKFKTELGDNYLLVKSVWDEICKSGFSIECADPLGPHERPVDQCTDLEKILLACITYLEDGEQKRELIKTFLLTVYSHHQIAPGVTIKVRKSFLIVIE